MLSIITQIANTTNLISILIFSAIQGILEAFPISSSMHIELLSNKLAMQTVPSEILHLGTSIAFTITCWPFIKHRLIFLFRSTLKILHQSSTIKNKKTRSLNHKLACTILGTKNISFNIKILINLILITLPTIVIGFLIKDVKPEISPLYCNLAAAISMLLADLLPARKSISSINYSSSILIGLLISLALIPGISRMGITFTVFRLFQFRRFDALFFTILTGIPITAGAALIGIIHNINSPFISIYITGSLLGGIATLLMLRITFWMLINCWTIFGAYRIFISVFMLMKH